MIRRPLTLILCLFAMLSIDAQVQKDSLRKFVVADIETRVPVRDAIVMTGSGYRDTTNYRGICYIPINFDTLTVYNPKYLTEKLLRKDTKDSTFLLPNSHRVSEVTVWGKDRATQLQENVGKWIQGDSLTNVLRNAKSGMSFDLAKMLDGRYRKDMKHLEKTRGLFKEMNKYDDDPIVNAYMKEMEEKRLAAERKKKLEEEKQQLRQEDQKAFNEKKKVTEETKEEIAQ